MPVAPDEESEAAVTVAITRHVDPEHQEEMMAWVRAGTQLAERFRGFLGSGWVRPAADSDEWHMLYRFDSAESLGRWDRSPQRRWWLDSAQAFVAEAKLERRTGIEGWFDDPTSVDAQDLRPAPKPPPRWKQALAIAVIFIPLSILMNYLAGLVISHWWMPMRVIAISALMLPAMTYFLLPWITRALAPWLNKQPKI